MKRIQRSRRLVTTAVVAGAVAVAGAAFTASNTISSGGNAGDGNAVISGFTVSNVSYQLQSGDPTYLASVTFDLSPAATDVRAKVNAASTTYVTCTPATSSASKTCSFPASTQTVLAADNLRVIAGN